MRRVPSTAEEYSAALAIALDRSAPADTRELAEQRMRELGYSFQRGPRRRRKLIHPALGELICESIEHRAFEPDPE